MNRVKAREVAIPQSFSWHILLLDYLRPVPHTLVIAKEESVLTPKRSAEGASKIVCALGRLNHLRHGHSRSIQDLVLKILKRGSMKNICARFAGRRNVRRVAIFCSTARPLHLHFCNAFRGGKHLPLRA